MILPWLILIPFIGGLLCWQTERFGNTLPRWIAITLTTSTGSGMRGSPDTVSPTSMTSRQPPHCAEMRSNSA